MTIQSTTQAQSQSLGVAHQHSLTDINWRLMPRADLFPRPRLKDLVYVTRYEYVHHSNRTYIDFNCAVQRTIPRDSNPDLSCPRNRNFRNPETNCQTPFCVGYIVHRHGLPSLLPPPPFRFAYLLLSHFHLSSHPHHPNQSPTPPATNLTASATYPSAASPSESHSESSQ